VTAGRARRPMRRYRRAGAGSFFACLTPLLLALVFLSSLDFHPPGDAHDAVAGSARQVYYPGASHPRAQHHAEPGQAAQRELCPVCLNRLQTSGAHHAPAVQLPAADPGDRVAALLATVPLARTRRPRGGRAPPFA
jgi:hypothetical protein